MKLYKITETEDGEENEIKNINNNVGKGEVEEKLIKRKEKEVEEEVIKKENMIQIKKKEDENQNYILNLLCCKTIKEKDEPLLS
jgi:hypothetical protein